MKENNLNNEKNVENKDIYYKQKGEMTKSVFELFKNSKEGNFNNLKKLIDEEEFQGSILNIALRKVIKEFKQEENYIQCIKLLLSSNIDLNYKYSEENSDNDITILMMISEKNNFLLLELLLETLQAKIKSNNNNFLSNEEKEKYEILEKQKFFSQKDSENNNFFYHYKIDNYIKEELFNSIEYLYDKYPKQYNPSLGLSKKIQEIFKKLFTETNNDGNNFMNICLENGLPKLFLKLISINGYIPNINKKKNNNIHTAILGKNFSCLKIVLYYCSYDELNMKNNEMLTPSEFAYKNGYITMSNIIIEYQNNFNEKEYKEHFYSNMEIYLKKILCLSNDLLVNFENYKLKELLYELKELKIINNLSSDVSNSNNNILSEDEDLFFKISYFKLEWNILLTQIRINQTDYEKDSLNNNNNNLNNNKLLKIIKKNLKKNEDKNKIINSTFFKIYFDFFENYFSNKFIYLYIDLINQINNKNINKINDDQLSISYFNKEKLIEILIYNKIIFYFKFGYTESLIQTAEIYFLKIFCKNNDNNDNIKNKTSFILFINISFILAETFISQGYHNFAEIIINSIEKYLGKCTPLNTDITNDIIIFNYLNKIGVLNQYSENFNEINCYSNFLRLLISKDKNKEYFTQNQRLLISPRFAKENPIFNRLYILLSCLEIKKSYEKEDNKIYNKIYELKKFEEEGEIFYFNTIGILYLKKKKYNLSIYFFKKALSKYIQIIKSKYIPTNQKEKFVNYRIDYITSFLYNISLCHFYLKNYNKCITILEQLLLFKCNQKNYFFYYRLGLCYLYMYIDENKKNCDNYNENILKVVGYEKNKNNNSKNKNNKSLSIDLDNDNDNNYENLSNQFNSEYKKNINERIFNNYNKKYLKENNNIYYNINNNNNPTLKKIILKNSTKIINNNIFTNKINNNNININNNKKNNNIFNEESHINNIKTNYLDKAIKSFKKVNLISKKELNLESIKSLHNFFSSYTKDDKNDKEQDNIKKYYKKKKIPNDLLINTYLNLLLCLSIKKNWFEMILIIKEYNNRKIVSNKVIILKILLYKLEAYVNIKNSQKIKEIINKLKGYKKIELTLFNKVNKDIINEVNIKFYLYYTLTLISIREKNFKDMEINMNKMLSLTKEEKNVPYYIIDLLLNVYLIKLNNEKNLNEKTKFSYNNIILNLIKKKKTNLEE